MNTEYIACVVNGLEYGGWKSVNIKASIKKAARSFSLGSAEREGEWVFVPGAEIEIYASPVKGARGNLVVTGYVDHYKPSINPTDHPVSITGRSKSADFVDSAAKLKDGHAEKKDPGQIAKMMNRFGIPVKVTGTLEKIPYFQVTQGESAFRAIDREVRKQGFTMMGTPDGGFEITKAGEGRHAGALVEGINIDGGSSDLSQDKRFSEYKVKGQARTGTKPEDLRIEETVKDPGVKRHRPKIIIHEGDTSKASAKKRAESEKNRRAGESTKATIKTTGWRDDAGQLWSPNKLIYVKSPSLKLDGDMLIENVDYSQSTETITTLSLVDPRAYGGKKAGKSKSAKVYGDM